MKEKAEFVGKNNSKECILMAPIEDWYGFLEFAEDCEEIVGEKIFKIVDGVKHGIGFNWTEGVLSPTNHYIHGEQGTDVVPIVTVSFEYGKLQAEDGPETWITFRIVEEEYVSDPIAEITKKESEKRGPLSIEDLQEIYRIEKKCGALTAIRMDFYKVVEDLEKKVCAEYDRELQKNPESVICEGAKMRKKRCSQIKKDIIEMRMAKINKLALRKSVGADDSTDCMTDEERNYYNRLLDVAGSVFGKISVRVV